MRTAPVILFVYNRPEHTFRTLESLRANELAGESRLFIFADGVKEGASAETKAQVAKTREVIRSAQWCGEVEIIESPENKGLADSVMNGVSKVIGQYGSAIVLEDDMITAPGFLHFMNDSLERYSTENNVACISGYVYPLANEFELSFFVKGADCWGWATWEDRWNEFKGNTKDLKKKIEEKGLLADLTFNGSYPYMEMLVDREAGKNQSWAILWYAWALVTNRLCLYPPASLVHNTGNDGSGTHSSQASDRFDVKLHDETVSFPDVVQESTEGRKAFEMFFRTLSSGDPAPLHKRILQRLKRMFS